MNYGVLALICSFCNWPNFINAMEHNFALTSAASKTAVAISHPLPKLQSKRLYLEPFHASHAKKLGKQLDRPGVGQYLPFMARAVTTEELIQNIEGRLERINDPIGLWSIIRKFPRNIIGICGYVDFDRKNKSTDGFIVLGAKYMGKGFGTEAVQALCAYAFSQCNIERICTRIYPENTASAKMIQKVGFQEKKTYPDCFGAGKSLTEIELTEKQLSKSS